MEEDEELPKFAINITSKIVGRSVKAFCFIRSIDEMGIAVSYPGGTTGYIKVDQISSKINEDLKSGTEVDLNDYYQVGESLITSLSAKRKKNKLHLSIRPEYINQHVRVDQFKKGQNIQV